MPNNGPRNLHEMKQMRDKRLAQIEDEIDGLEFHSQRFDDADGVVKTDKVEAGQLKEPMTPEDRFLQDLEIEGAAQEAAYNAINKKYADEIKKYGGTEGMSDNLKRLIRGQLELDKARLKNKFISDIIEDDKRTNPDKKFRFGEGGPLEVFKGSFATPDRGYDMPHIPQGEDEESVPMFKGEKIYPDEPMEPSRFMRIKKFKDMREI